jgi:DNA processing protein
MEKGSSRATRDIADHELKAWLVLSRMPGLGDLRIATLVQRLGSPEEVLDASPQAIAAILKQDQHRLSQAKTTAETPAIEKQITALKNGPYRLYTIWNTDYPASLKTLSTPPVLLFSRGELHADDQNAVAVVGSRSATEYGKTVAYDLAQSLAWAGFCVVSGMARGIDSFAHKGALDGGGRTVAVLGNGPDVAYPPENRKLMREIEQQGAVVSEFPPGTAPNPKHFPRRNRIIAGLSRGVIVVQARERSGALITAKHALEQGKEVMAVPGPINARTSKGPNALIKQGAALVEDLDDVLAALGEPLLDRDDKPKPPPCPPLEPEERSLLEKLGKNPVHIDTLCTLTGEPPGRLLAKLLHLELKGVVKQLAGKHFLALVDLS